MSNAIEFLEFDEVLAIHERQIERYGGSPGLRDQSLLESALAVPESTFDGEYLHSDLFEMAAAYAFHISQNHPFFDGNKRTGLLTALTFLDTNGITVGTPSPRLYEAMMQIAEGRMRKKELAALFRSLAQHRDS